jgi:hypothetical protein
MRVDKMSKFDKQIILNKDKLPEQLSSKKTGAIYICDVDRVTNNLRVYKMVAKKGFWSMVQDTFNPTQWGYYLSYRGGEPVPLDYNFKWDLVTDKKIISTVISEYNRHKEKNKDESSVPLVHIDDADTNDQIIKSSK